MDPRKEAEIDVLIKSLTGKNKVEISTLLQDLLLEDFVKILASGMATPADRATITRFLTNSGFTLQESALPTGLSALVKKALPDPNELEVDSTVITR